jgi:hypothetical protein
MLVSLRGGCPDRVLRDKAQEAILAANIVGLLEEDTHVILPLLQPLCPELLALKRWFLL